MTVSQKEKSKTFHKIEVTGTIDDNHQLHLDAPLTELEPGKVRVVIVAGDGDFDIIRVFPGITEGPGYIDEDGEYVYSISEVRPIQWDDEEEDIDDDDEARQHSPG